MMRSGGTRMPGFDYSTSSEPIRADLADAHRQAWAHIARPGAWLTGAERVAVAEETRRARACVLCARRKAALSPYADPEFHAARAPLAAPLVDAIHRVTTDASRLTKKWFGALAAQGVTHERYVEALGVAVLAISVDAFHLALGFPLEPLPEPERGDPTRTRPEGLTSGEGWVPMIDPAQAGPGESDLFFKKGPLRAAYVIRALTLTPNEARAWIELSGAQYLSPARMTRLDTGRAIDRAQMELVAGRVSALNHCFY
jgi:hypothetical protein